MINSKPKIGTLFSVGLFLVIAYGVFFYSLLEYLNSSVTSTVTMILLISTGPIALTITIKTLFGIKLIEISKEKFSLHYPFRFKKIKFTGKDLSSWKIDKIKTFGGVYEELLWKTKSGAQYSMSRQEHTEYDKARNYMLKKFKNIQQS